VIIDANEKGDTAPLIKNLEKIEIFRDKNKKEEVSVTDLIN